MHGLDAEHYSGVPLIEHRSPTRLPLVPILFLVFIDDLVRELSQIAVRAVVRYTLQPKLRLPRMSYSQFSLSQYRVDHNTGSYPYDSLN